MKTLLIQLLKKHRLPGAELARRCQVSVKTIEKNRSSIILLTLLMRSDLQVYSILYRSFSRGGLFNEKREQFSALIRNMLIYLHQIVTWSKFYGSPDMAAGKEINMDTAITNVEPAVKSRRLKISLATACLVLLLAVGLILSQGFLTGPVYATLSIDVNPQS